MPAFTATLTQVAVLAGGLWMLCSQVYTTAGFTAPACLASGITSGIGILIGLGVDVVGAQAGGRNNPDQKRTPTQDWITYHRMHDNGTLEDYTGRLHEIWNHPDEDVWTILDTNAGYTHSVSTRGNSTMRVATDFTQGTESRRLRRRQTSDQSYRELDLVVYNAEKVADVGDTLTQADLAPLGQDIANQAYELGTWCTSIYDGATVFLEMGLTLSSQQPGGYVPAAEQGPCAAR